MVDALDKKALIVFQHFSGDEVIVNITRNPGGHPTAERAAAIGKSVVSATMIAFAEKGSTFSMDEVARLAGVSKQAIYRRWHSKIDLVVEAVESILSDSLDQWSETFDDPVAALRALSWRHFSMYQSTSHRLSLYLQLESFNNRRLADHLTQWNIRIFKLYRASLLNIDKAGRRTAGDIDLQAELAMDFVSGAARRSTIDASPDSNLHVDYFNTRWTILKGFLVIN